MKKSPQTYLFILNCLLLLCQVNPLCAQSPVMLPEKHYTDENGLPQNSVKFIAPGEMGYLWMATENGMVRFDGKQFRIYNSVNLNIRSGRINYLYTDSKGLHATNENRTVIDIGNGTAVTRYWKWLTPASYYESFLVSDFTYTLPASGLPNFYRPVIVAMSEYMIPGIGDTSYLIRSDSIWLQQGREVIQKTHFKYKDHLSFFFFEKELCYLDTNNGVFTGFENLQPVLRNVTGDITTNKLWNRQRNQLQLYWNAAAGQLFIHLGKELYQVKRLPNGDLHTNMLLADVDLPRLVVVSIYYNQEAGRLFLGTNGFGMYTFIQQKFSTIGTDKGGDPVQYAQAPYGNKAVISPSGMTYHADSGNALVSHSILKKLYIRDKFNLVKDKKGHVWYKNADHLYELDSACNTILNQYTLPDFITSLYVGDNHKLWIGTYLGSVWYCENGKVQPYLSLSDRISCLKEGKEGILWVGTDKGLWRTKIDTRETTAVAGLENKGIRCMYEPDNNELWIGTFGYGFYHYNGKTLTEFPLDAQKYLSVVHCIIPDENGYFWMTTNKGLFQIARQDLLSYAKQPTGQVFYMYYARESGFKTNEFNGGCEPCALRLDDGRISMPSMNGFVLLSPNQELHELPEKPLFWDAITVDGKTYSDYDTVWLQHKFKQLTVECSTPYFGNEYNLRLEYALVADHKDTSWLSVPDNHILAFFALPSGPHALLIRKLNGFGYGNYTYRQLVIMVAPAYYETAWFKILLVNIGLLLIFLYFSLRMYFLKKRNIQLEQYAQTRTRELAASKSRLREQLLMQEKLVAAISHDIKTPMRYLVYGAERMIDKALAPDQMKEEAGIIYDTSYRMYFLLDNLISYIKTNLQGASINMEEVDLSYLVEEKIAIFAPIAATKQTVIHNEIPTGMLIHSNLLILGIIIHNLLDNAVKNTIDGQIRLTASPKEQRVHITISDTGTGFQPEVLSWLQREAGLEDASLSATNPALYGIGLAMVLELIRLLKGQLYVQSTPDKGTSITLSIAV